MANSHADVGAAFGSNRQRPCKGSRMHTHPVIAPRILSHTEMSYAPPATLSLAHPHNPDDTAAPIPGETLGNLSPMLHPFVLVNIGYSYQTPVVWLVHNRYAQHMPRGHRYELWITPQHHSQSTQRHIGHYITGFCKAHAFTHRWGDSEDTTETRPIYYTAAVDRVSILPASSRCNPTWADSLLDVLTRNNLPGVLAPRIRNATRIGLLQSTLRLVRTALRRMTRDVPSAEWITSGTLSPDHPFVGAYARAVGELRAMEAFIVNTLALVPSAAPGSPTMDDAVAEVRAAVAGFLALNTNTTTN